MILHCRLWHQLHLHRHLTQVIRLSILRQGQYFVSWLIEFQLGQGDRRLANKVVADPPIVIVDLKQSRLGYHQDSRRICGHSQLLPKLNRPSEPLSLQVSVENIGLRSIQAKRSREKESFKTQRQQ